MADKAFATLAATSLRAMTMKIPTFFRTTDSNLSGFWKYKWVGRATRMQVISDPRLITKDLFIRVLGKSFFKKNVILFVKNMQGHMIINFKRMKWNINRIMQMNKKKKI